MIIELVMNVLKFFLLLIIGLFPALPDMSGLIAVVDPVFSVIHWINYLLDLRILSLCFVALILFSNLELVWGVIMWVVRKIPGVN